MNIIEEVQKLIGHSPVQKIDPNAQASEAEIHDNAADLLYQAAIPVALTGLYKYTRSEDDAANLVGKIHTTGSWPNELFGEQAHEVIQHVADYAHVSSERAKAAIDDAAASAIKVANNNAGSYATANSIATFFKDGNTEVLKHLPPALQLGSLLNDNTIDDRTHKMEGPVSGLMHSIENLFSDSDANDSSKQ